MKTLLQKKERVAALLKAIIIVELIAIIIILSLGIYGKKTKSLSQGEDFELDFSMYYYQFQDEDSNVEGTDNVKFNAFFLRDLYGDGYAEKLSGSCREVGYQDNLYMEINVLTEGILKNAKIEIDGKNFYFKTALPKDDQLKNSYISNNTKLIEFNDLTNGTQKMLIGFTTVSAQNNSLSALNNNIYNYSRNDNKIILTGTYVTEENEEIEIRKEVDLSVDWYGEVGAGFYRKTYDYYDLQNRINEDNETINLSFTIEPEETKDKLLIRSNVVEGTLPELNGCKPISVSCLSSDCTFEYNEETMEFRITKEAQVNGSGTINKSVSRKGFYKINVVYPIAAYNVGEEVLLPVRTYYTGYENVNDWNAYYDDNTYYLESNVAEAVIVTRFYYKPLKDFTYDVEIGERRSNPYTRYMVSKNNPLKMYSGYEPDPEDIYMVRWFGTTGDEGVENGVVFRERRASEATVSDVFIKSDATEESMEDITSNIGIAFFASGEFIDAENGWLRIYDDVTNELIKEFSYAELLEYGNSNPYMYENPIKHIRIETSEIKPGLSYVFYNFKNLDDDKIVEKYTEEEFERLSYIKTKLTVTFNNGIGEGVSDFHQAVYEAPFTNATLQLSNRTISTQTTEHNDILSIDCSKDLGNNVLGWKNGNFVIKIPNEIIDLKINNIYIDSELVDILSYELIENDEGRFIRIRTHNKYDVDASYRIYIDTDISPDPRIATTTAFFRLYSYNEETPNYINKTQDLYDVNDNGSTTDVVGTSSLSIGLVSPNSLLISQSASEYDEEENFVVSPQIADVRPQYAILDGNGNTAKIGIQLKNNYSGSISEMLMIGVIPFEGNRYVISYNDMSSEYSTNITSDGLIIPAELEGEVDVYYTSNPTPDNNINNEANGWRTKEEVTDWDEIKNFMVDFKDYVLDPAKSLNFEYTIEIPDGIDFNKVTYSETGVYFCLHTPEGKYATQTEPNKLGFRIAQKYMVTVQKFHKDRDLIVPGAVYEIVRIGDEEGKTGLTADNGSLTIKNLYAEEEYILKEIASPVNYDINDDELRFVAHADRSTGEVTFDLIEGTVKGDITVTKEDGKDHEANIKLEDEVRATLNVRKVYLDEDSGTEVGLKGVKFVLKGPNMPEAGRTITTNDVGECTLSGLKVGEEYTLQETKAEGYYLSQNVVFEVDNNNGVYSLDIISSGDNIFYSTLSEADNVPVARIELSNEKIPTFDLEIEKTNADYDRETEKIYLANAKFALYRNGEYIDSYITDENGSVTINGLYVYNPEKGQRQDYTLKEIESPDGYIPIREMNFYVDTENDLLRLVEDVPNGVEPKRYSVSNNRILLTIEDKPSFTLVKEDKETEELLPNTKFAIYDIATGDFAKNGKGEYLGEYEEINGEYYYTFTTNQEGKFDASIGEGDYKLVELEASEDKYEVNETPRFFSIGRELTSIFTDIKWVKDCEDGNTTFVAPINSIGTEDGGAVVIGYFEGAEYRPREDIILKGHKRNSSYAPTAYITKYDIDGEVEWADYFIGDYWDKLIAIEETNDGGLLVGGFSNSGTFSSTNGITISGTNDVKEILIKYNSSGQVEWMKKYGYGKIISICELSDGSFVCAMPIQKTSTIGNTNIRSSTNYSMMVIVGLTSTGDVNWVKYYEKSNTEEGAWSVELYANEDDDIFIYDNFEIDQVTIGDATFTNLGTGKDDLYVTKMDKDGNFLWTDRLGSTGDDVLKALIPTHDGGAIVAGYSPMRNVYFNDEIDSNHSNGHWLMKIDGDGNHVWTKRESGLNVERLTRGKDDKIIFMGRSAGLDVDGVRIINDGTGLITGEIDDDGIVQWGALISSEVRATYDKDLFYSAVTDSYIGVIYYGTIKVGNTVYGKNTEEDAIVFNYSLYEDSNSQNERRNTLTIKNEIKEFKISTGIDETEGVRGGTISGEGLSVYEKVKYNETSTKDILITPKEGYSIVSIKVNGENYVFTPNPDGSYLMPAFENMIEDKKVVVKFMATENILTINKVDSDTGELLEGVTFNIDQQEERESPTDKIGDLVDAGQPYYRLIDEDSSISNNLLGELTDNGIKTYTNVVIDEENEVLGKFGELTDSGDYYFVEIDGKLVPTNSQPYINEYGDGEVPSGATYAGSYIKVDLSDLTGNYIIRINAETKTYSSNHGFAYINKETNKTMYADTDDRIFDIYGTKSANNYDSTILEGGNVYYLHIGFSRAYVATSYENSMSINSIKLYPAEAELESEGYSFVESEGKYVSTNQGIDTSRCHSYIPIDLTGYTDDDEFIIKLNYDISSETNDYGYFYLTESSSRPYTNQALGINGERSEQSFSKTMKGGKKYFLHFAYNKNYSNSSGDDALRVYNVNLYKETKLVHSFIKEDEIIKSTNQNYSQSTCSSYIPIDLREHEGKYNLTINVKTRLSTGDIAFARVIDSEEVMGPSSNPGRFMYLTGNYTNRNYSTVIEGGKINYLHFGFYNNNCDSEDTLYVNSITITPNTDYLYHTTVTTNNVGVANAQIPYGKYHITEISTPEGYIINNEPVVVEFRDAVSTNREITIENTKYRNVIVHHYLKGTTEKVADDEILEGKTGDPYVANPIMDSLKYRLEEVDGEPVIPNNTTGVFTVENQEVIFYYIAEKEAVIVNHFIEGSEIPVKLRDGTNAESVILRGDVGEEYHSSPLSNETIDRFYELASEPDDKDGIFTDEAQTINYYYKPLEREVVINKTNEDGEPLSNVKFELNNKNVSLGDIVNNGFDYYNYVIDEDNTYNEAIGNLEQYNPEMLADYMDVNDLGVFVNEGEGVLVPSNCGEKLIADPAYDLDDFNVNRYAFSYIPIDLSDKTGKYKIVVNAENVGDGNQCGVISLFSDIFVPYFDYYYESHRDEFLQYDDEYNDYYDTIFYDYEFDNSGVIAALYGNMDAKDYESAVLDGGYKYYLMLSYFGTPDVISDRMQINSIDVYEAVPEIVNYTFTNDNGALVSNNQKTRNTLASAYIPLDLTDYAGDYELTINAEMSCEYEYDYGFIAITSSEEIPYIDFYNGPTFPCLDYTTLSGPIPQQDYTYSIPGGEKYYIHIGYYKDSYACRGEDTFRINYISGSNLQLETDEGKIELNLPGGIYGLTETETIDGYKLLDNIDDIVVDNSTDNPFVINIENKKIVGQVTVHHYIEGTTTPVKLDSGENCADEVLTGHLDETYTVTPKTELELGYSYSYSTKDLTGPFTEEPIEIICYYSFEPTTPKSVSYTINYYKDGVLQDDDVDTINTTIAVTETEIPVDKNGINTTNKYEGYILNEEDTVIPDTIADKGEIDVYYIKRNDIHYTVNYLEKGSNNIVSTAKTDVATFEDEILAVDEEIPIDGYNHDSNNPNSIIIGVDESQNVLNIYYTKRNDIHYTVNYLEKGTNKVVKTAKTDVATFDDTINAVDEEVPITGYNHDSNDPTSIKIKTDESQNVLNIYYTKKNDLSYTVNYLEKGTNKVISTAKTENNQVYGTVINSLDEVIDIDGYNYDSVDKDSLTIGVETNEITIYYTKVTGISYRVNYLEDGTEDRVKPAKITGNMTYGDVVNSSSEAIDIEGYTFVRADKEKLTIGTNVDANVINLYYAKRTDLSYTVNYLDEATNRTVHDPKEIHNATFGEKIEASKEIIDVDGYRYSTSTPDEITIGVDAAQNVITIYYAKRTDLNYTVKYINKDTGLDIIDPKVEQKSYKTIIYSISEIIDMAKYDFVEYDKEYIEVGTNEDENVISLFYTKKNGNVYVHHYKDGTTEKLVDDVILTGKVDTEYHALPAENVDDNYELVADPDNKDGVFTVQPIEVNYYYKLKDAVLIVEHKEKGTTEKVSEDTVENTTRLAEFSLEDFVKDIDGYVLDREFVNEEFTIDGDTIVKTIYYEPKGKVVVHYVDQDNPDVDLDTVEKEDIVGEEFETYPISIDGYVLKESPDSPAVVISKGTQDVYYYYKKVSEGLIEKHIDEENNSILYEELHTGEVGEEYEILPKEFDRYTLDEEKLPTNSKGTYTDELIEVVYKYEYIARVRIEYVDQDGNNIADPIDLEGKIGDEYHSEEKPINKYELIEVVGTPDGEMTREDIVVTYRYQKIANKVIENHIDILDDEVLYNEEHSVNPGETYETKPINLDDYDVVEERLPSNGSGEMGDEDIIINYYYIRKAVVNVEYVDFYTGKSITEETQFKGHVGDKYSSKEQDVPGYRLVKEQYPLNASGTMTKEPTIVTYFYVKESRVIERHIFKDTVLYEKIHTGLEGDEYDIKPKTFDNYIVDEDSLPKNAKGYMDEGDIVVTYRYVNKAVVIEKHIDEDDKTVLVYERHEGKVGDRYDISSRRFSEYELEYTSTENNRGYMTVEPIEVIFWYKKAEKKSTPAQEEPKAEPSPVTVIIKDGGKTTTTTVTPKSDNTIVKNVTNTSPKVDPDEVVRNVPDTESDTNRIFYALSGFMVFAGMGIMKKNRVISKKKLKENK